MKNKLISIAVSILTIIPIISYAQQSEKREDLNKYINKYGQVLFYLNNYYLDTLNNNNVTDEAIKSLVSTLDPHSSYISAKDVKAMNEPLEGNFEGVGIEFAIIRDTLTVASPILGGPSESVGIRAGDKIVAIDSDKVAAIGLTNDMVFKYLRGTKGSKVKLTIYRRGVKEPLVFDVVRDKIPINSVDATYEAAPGVAYVKLSRFAANSAHEIISSLLALKMEFISGFILDLRGNSGGFLGTAIEISNFFLNAGQTIVYTEGLKMPKMTERAKGTGFYKKGSLAILVDENSASASEIVAGAIQDWDRGVIIGRKTFGKGLVQQMLPLNDGSQLRLTVARYHTPSGRVIQSPYEAGSSQSYYRAILERYEKGESFNRDSIHFPDSLKYKTLLQGRTVYGGGGIMPDIFIPADTTYFTNYYAQLIRKGVILDFMNDFSDKNRESMKVKYSVFETFNDSFMIDKTMTDSLVEYATQKGVKYSSEEFEKSVLEIETYMKALVARSLFGTTAYFRIVNGANDKIFKRALEAVTSKTL